VHDEDGESEDPANTKMQDSFLDGIQYHFITGTIGKCAYNPVNLLGDGFSSRGSGTGFCDSNSKHNVREFLGTSHVNLASSLEVYEQIKAWIMQPSEFPVDFYLNEEIYHAAMNEFGPYRDDGQYNGEDVHSVLRDSCDDMDAVDATDALNNTSREIESELTSQEGKKGSKIRGTVSLVQDAVCLGVSAVEFVQNEKTDEIYSIISLIRPIAPVARGVQSVQKTVTGVVYGTMRGVATGTGETIKLFL